MTRRSAVLLLSIGVLGVLGAAPAAGTPLAAVNALRAQGCDGRAPAPRLRAEPRLDAAARRLAGGEALGAATRGAGYRATQSTALQLVGVDGDAALARALATRFCGEVLQPGLREFGSFRRGSELWIVLATPFSPPAPADAERVAARVLALVNEARAAGRRCGAESLPPAPPLQRAAALDRAATLHSRAMARQGFFAHEAPDGSTPAARAERAGYRWQAIAENIAAGAGSAEAVVAGWLESPGHCRNLMSPRYTEMGLGYHADAGSRAGIYWTQMFGTPR